MIDTLLRASWQGGLVCLVVALLVCLPKLSASARAWLWRLVPAKFLLTLAVSGAVALPLLAPPPAPSTAPAAPAPLAPLSLPEPILVQEASSAPPPLPLPEPTPFPWEQALLGLYLLGVLAALVRLLHAAGQARQWRAQTLPLTEVAVQDEARTLSQALRLRSQPALALSPTLASPAILGVLHPVIVLPERLLSDPDARRTALAHELAHARRGDLFWSALTALAGVLFWFHPLLWLSRRELAVAQEMACDCLALELTATAPATYGKTLLTLAVPGSLPPALASGSASHLKRRLRALQHLRKPSPTTALTAFVLSTLVTVPWRLTYAQRPSAAPQPGKTVGQVFGPAGKPVAGARVRLVVAIPYSAKALEEAQTDPEGRFTLSQAVPTATAPNGQEIPTGWLLAQAPGLGLSVTIPAPGAPARLTLAPAGTHEVLYQDTEGKPLVGLAVEAGSVSGKHGNFPLSWLPGMTGKTDSRGAFQVSGAAAEATVHFDVKDPKWAVVSKKTETLGSTHRTRVTLRTGLTISGTLRFADGRPARNVRVWCNPLNSKQLGTSAFSQSDGRYTLSGLTPGYHRVCVETWEKDFTTVYKPKVLLGSAALTKVDFTLSKGAVVTGRITDTAGKPLYGVWVGGGPLSGGKRDYTAYAVSDKNGRYRVRVPAGKALVQLRGGSQVGTVVEKAPVSVVTVREGETTTQNFSISGRAPRELSGTLVAEDGQPITGAKIGYPSHLGYLELYTVSPEGRFRFRSIWKTPKLTLYIQKGEQLASITVPVQTNQRLVVRWETKSLATLSGRVVDAAGNPIPQAQVRLIRYFAANKGGDGREVFLTDSQGRFSQKVYSAWRYRIEVEKDSYGQLMAPLLFQNQKLREPLAVAPGQTHDFGKLVLPKADLTITGKVLDPKGEPLGNVSVCASSPHGRFRQVKSLANGTFEIGGLVREPLHVWISDPRYKSAPISIPTDSGPLTIQAEAQAQFLSSLVQAKELAQKTKRPLLIHFASHICTNDRDVEARILPDPRVQARLNGYVTVRLFGDPGRYATPAQATQNARYQQALLKGPPITPAFALVSPEGKLLKSTSYNTARDAATFANWLKP